MNDNMHDGEQAALLSSCRNTALGYSIDPERRLLRLVGLELREVLWYTEGGGLALLQERRGAGRRIGRTVLPTTVLIAEEKQYTPQDNYIAPYHRGPIVRAYGMHLDRSPAHISAHSWVPEGNDHLANMRAALDDARTWQQALHAPPDEEEMGRLQDELLRAASGLYIANIVQLRGPRNN